MALDGVDGILAGMQYPREFIKAATPTLVAGRPHSLFYLAGMPGAATAPSPGVAGAALTSYAGQIPFSNPSGGGVTRLVRLQGQVGVACTLVLADRLWHNSGLDVTNTGAQAVNSVAWPARDATGSSDGVEVQVALEVSTATGAGTPSFTMGYTNSAGATSRTGTGILTGVASSAIGAFYPIGLQAGDSGVRSIQSFQFSASWTSGAVHLVAYRVLARLHLPLAQTPGAVDALTGGFARMYDNTVPFLFIIPATTTASVVIGHVIWSQG